MLQFLMRIYSAPFRLLAWGMVLYQANRQRLRVFMERPQARLLYRVLILMTLIGWLLIGLLTWNSGSDDLSNYLRQLAPWIKQP